MAFWFNRQWARKMTFLLRPSVNIEHFSFLREFRRLRAATFFFHGEKEGKTPPGTAPDEHFVLIVAFPRTPVYEGYPLEQEESFRRTKSEWLV